MTAETNVIYADELQNLSSNVDIEEGSSLVNDKNSTNEKGSMSSDSGTEGSLPMSQLHKDLRRLSDGAVILRLKLRQKRGSGPSATRPGDSSVVSKREVSITLVCCHNWFNPVRPDVKTAQCRILFGAIERFHQRCRVLGGSQSELQGQDHSQLTACYDEPTNLILCGDFNSVPIVQPEFLPEPLKTAAMVTLLKSNQPSSNASTTDRNSSIYPDNENSASGVYALLAFGRVSPTHPEHPDTFIPHHFRKGVGNCPPNSSISPDTLSNQREHPPTISHQLHGEWSSGYGTLLEDVYRDRGDAAPRFTTNTRTFSGIIDHIFVSSGEPGGLSVRSVLAFPPGANMVSSVPVSTPANSSVSMKSLDVTPSEGRADVVGEAPSTTTEDDVVMSQEGTCTEIGPIPDFFWGSDHLALGVEVTVK